MAKKDRGRSRETEIVSSRAGNYQIALWSLSSLLGILFLLQSLREFFASIYFYNLISLSVSPVSALLIIFLLPLLTGRIVKLLGLRSSYLLAGAVMTASRVPMGMGLNRPMHLIFSTICLVSSMYFLSLVLAVHKRERKIDPEAFSSQSLVAYFGIAYLALMFFVTMGHGIDPSIVPEAVGFVLSPAISTALAGLFGLILFLQRRSILLRRDREGIYPVGSLFTGGLADSWAPAWGIFGSIFVMFGIVSNPAIVAGWIGVNFQWVISSAMASLGIFLLSLLSSSGLLLSLRRTFSNPKGAIIGNLIMLLAAANLFYIQIPVPVAPAVITWIAMVDTWIIMDAMTDHRPFAGESFQIESGTGRKVIGFPHRSKNRSFPGHFGKAVSLGIGAFALLIVLLTVSLNWSFVPLGFLLKGAVPSLMFAGVVVLALSGFSCSKFRIEEPWIRMDGPSLKLDKGSPTMAAGKGMGSVRKNAHISQRLRTQWLTIGAVTISLIILTGGAAVVNYIEPMREKGLADDESIIVATYNIHHGFTNDGRIDPTKHFKLIEEVDPDILFLQESDSLLFSEGNFDPAFYLSSRLDMFIFRGPDPGTGSPGVAILSKFPMEELEVHYLPSDAIQRIALSCIIEPRDQKVRLIGLHMGLEEDERGDQMEELYEIASGFDEDLMIIGGDLNTQPDEEMMEFMNPDLFRNGNHTGNRTLGLSSVWHSSPSRGGRPIDTPTYPAPDVDDEEEHIDYVLFSDGFEVNEARIVDGTGISDHRMVWGELSMLV